MSVARLLSLCLLVAHSAACSSSRIPGPPGLSHAVAAPSCGPADGPAVAIYLTPSTVQSLEPAPPPPYVYIYVWQSPHSLAGRSWTLAGSEPQGSASFYSTAQQFEAATSGTLTVTSVAPDNTIEGSVDLTFPSAGRIRGGFRAAWLARAMLCG